ncbi:UNVERIFIED_CONTAM: hypothetical protein GTU68_049015 [Idotea baltica]|jgi:hypothetical protein
MLLN